MTYCFNSSCDRPHNPPQAKFCHHCGSSLLIAQRFRAVQSLQSSSFLVTDQHHPAQCKAVALRFSSEHQAKVRQHICQLEALSPHPCLPKVLAVVEWEGTQESALFVIREWVEDSLGAVPSQNEHLHEQIKEVLRLLTQLLNLRVSLDQNAPTLQINGLLGNLQLDWSRDTHTNQQSEMLCGVWSGLDGRREETDLYQMGTVAVQWLSSQAQGIPANLPPLQMLATWEQQRSEPSAHELADILRRLLTAPQFQSAADILTAIASLRQTQPTPSCLSVQPSQPFSLTENGLSVSVVSATESLAPLAITPPSFDTVARACVLENLIAPDFSSDTPEPSTLVPPQVAQALQAGDFAQVSTSSLVKTLLTDPVQVPLGKLIKKAAQTHHSAESYLPQTIWEQIIQLQAQGKEAIVLAPRWLELGEFYREQVQQSSRHLVNLVLAIAAYEQARACVAIGFVFPLESYDMLGRLYWHLGRQQTSKRSRCFQVAIQTYQKGIQQLPTSDSSAADSLGVTSIHAPDTAQLWVELHHHLGEAYSDLAVVEQQPDHGRQAIEAFKAALALESPPKRLAMIHNNLGTACWTLAQSELGEAANALFQQAIASYNAAADQYDPDEDPLRYGMVQNNLGTAYLNLGQHSQSIDILRLAVGTYQVALIYRSRDAAPLSHAATQNNLGAACIQLAAHPYMDPVGVRGILEQAIAAYQEALMLVRELQLVGVHRFGFDPDTSQLNLGLAYQRLGMAAPSDSSQTFTVHLETAIQSYLDVLQQQPKESALYNSALDYLNQSIHYLSDEMGFPADHPALQSLPDHLYVEMSQRLQQQIELEAAV